MFHAMSPICSLVNAISFSKNFLQMQILVKYCIGRKLSTVFLAEISKAYVQKYYGV